MFKLNYQKNAVHYEDLNHLNVNHTFFENRKSFLVLLDGLSQNITNFLNEKGFVIDNKKYKKITYMTNNKGHIFLKKEIIQ